MLNRLKIAEGVMIEDLEKELVLTAPGSGKLDRLSGEGKEGLDAVRSDVAADLIDPIIAHLVGEGILTSTAGISRRGLALPGAARALSGVTVLAMPSASMATSSSAALATPILSPNRGVIGAYVGGTKAGANPSLTQFQLRRLESISIPR